MSTTGRQVVTSIGFSVLFALMIGAVFIYVYPLHSWSELWSKDFMDIPFIIFLPAFSIVAGILLGSVTGLYWRKQFHLIDQSLRQLEEGRYPEISQKPAVSELQSIATRMEKIGKQIAEQAKLSQRLATEKAVDQEARIQEIIEQERNRLARELHDSVSQQLFAASMMMSAINETKKQTDESLETKQLKMVEEMIHQSQLEMRALLLHLRPVALKNKTLQEGIEELLFELSQKVTLDIKWKLEDFPLDKGVEDHLFRILQESVSNTLRHARANQLEVLLIKREDLVILRVVDDGIGFEVEETKAGSYGMQNMHERAIEIGGTLKVISVKNKGTRLEVKVPVMENGVGAHD
ncbi:sensor histidine kinase [Neobacillus thermocopriae]|uniref:Sensor histidine kinase n=1 Tax=Neobacillus thermocopriae TaxID=1215031 RepID=A0A6B3TSL2_9BACI|nr:sensor histidine kinase [Neobacillus thermocopriae]MED3625213.1 sensor histidine kinase [Neobacillus thermocopriae]MED3715107.1 sensor histidine kinase [Neobacillus thermocopriae]NEX80045.1 sensor histidine kinase [Neobacillus thermocopriae]